MALNQALPSLKLQNRRFFDFFCMKFMVIDSDSFGSVDLFNSGLDLHSFTLLFIPIIDLALNHQQLGQQTVVPLQNLSAEIGLP